MEQSASRPFCGLTFGCDFGGAQAAICRIYGSCSAAIGRKVRHIIVDQHHARTYAAHSTGRQPKLYSLLNHLTTSRCDQPSQSSTSSLALFHHPSFSQQPRIMAPKGPFKLVTVNTAPERAKRLIGRMTEALKDQYTIDYVANCETIAEVEGKVKEHKPDVLFCASMWTADEAEQIQATARSIVPNIKTHAIPHGLQVERGPDAIVEHLLEKVPQLLES
ncbi:uncharacterized protein CCOS01_14739 [Colletotrichum costaricense]|nr:uncharacterized protein CCOS01_14739 [Colletotrichum costaricense]KAK1512499.1 hypothetical protein CCOS01_14739 [Colletotrichum costaricense]